jgi:hygromycin-B 7''-O-kinase
LTLARVDEGEGKGEDAMADQLRAASSFRALGNISAGQFGRAAERHALGRVLSTAPLGGAKGNNVAVRTDRGEWVLRGAVPPVEVTTLLRERFFARALCGRVRVSAPWPYIVDGSAEPFGWPYALMPRLAGDTPDTADAASWSSVGAALGRAVAELHQVTFACVGEWNADQDGIVAPAVSPGDWLLQRVDHLKARVAQTSSPLDPTSQALVDRRMGAAVAHLGTFEPTYVHGDVTVSNFVGRRTAGGWAFTGVFDLEAGYSGDPDEDLATPVWWPLYWHNPEAAQAFLAAYRRLRPSRPGQAARLRGYLVLSMLTNWEFGRRLRFDWYGGAETFARWCLPLLEQADAIIGR